jgi:hypothetical protein
MKHQVTHSRGIPAGGTEDRNQALLAESFPQQALDVILSLCNRSLPLSTGMSGPIFSLREREKSHRNPMTKSAEMADFRRDQIRSM